MYEQYNNEVERQTKHFFNILGTEGKVRIPGFKWCVCVPIGELFTQFLSTIHTGTATFGSFTRKGFLFGRFPLCSCDNCKNCFVFPIVTKAASDNFLNEDTTKKDRPAVLTIF